MPPFQYRTFQDPYVGDITRLMGAGPEAEARSIRDIGNIRAQEAQQKGAIRANLAQGLGAVAQGAYGTYKQHKIDQLVAEVANRINPAALAYVGEDRVRPVDWSQGAPWGGTPRTREQILGDRPPGVAIGTVATPEIDPSLSPAGHIDATGSIEVPSPADGPEFAGVWEERGTWDQPLTDEEAAFGGGVEARPVTRPTLGDVVAPPVPQDRGEPPRLWLNRTPEGVFDIGAIAEQLQREGLTSAEIDPEMARLNEYNTAQITLNDREKALGVDARTLRVDRSLGILFRQNPNPSFNEILGAVEGDTEQALDIQKTMAEGQKAKADIINGQFENLSGKLQAMMAAIDVFSTPSSQQAAWDLAKGELLASGQVPKEFLPLFEQLQTTDDFRRFVGNLAAQEDQGTIDEQIAQKISERQYAQRIGNTETVNQLDAEIDELRKIRIGLEQEIWRPYASTGGSSGGTSVLPDEAFAERVAALGIGPPMGKNMYETLQGFSGFFQSTGMPAALARTARSTFLIGDVMAGIPVMGDWGDRALEVKAQFLQAENEIMRRVVKNPRFPEAEQQRVLEMLNLSFGPLTSRGGPTAGLLELTRTLRQIQITRLAMRDIDAAEDIDRLLDYLGVPDYVARGEPAPLPVSSWEADGKRLFYDKDENLIEHLTEALE
jgi:hypothetical protein